MITKEQYVEIIDLVQRYVVMRKKVFPQNPMTNEFAAGIEKVIVLIQTLVKKRLVMTVQELIDKLNEIEDKSQQALHFDDSDIEELEEDSGYVILY